MRKGQGQRPLLDAHGLWALSRHCITHRHNSVIDITKWAQEYFQKLLSVNTIRRAICRCQLKLYHAKRKPYINMVQKHRNVLWAKAHLKWTVSKWKSVLWSDESKYAAYKCDLPFEKWPMYVSRRKQKHFIWPSESRCIYNRTEKPRCSNVCNAFYGRQFHGPRRGGHSDFAMTIWRLWISDCKYVLLLVYVFDIDCSNVEFCALCVCVCVCLRERKKERVRVQYLKNNVFFEH